MSDPSESKLAFLEELRRIAQWGLGYSTDAYDVERYTRLLELASIEYETLSGVPADVVQERFASEIGGNVTPKVGLDAAIFDEHGDLLLIRRHDDNLMALPGGWAELGETPEAGIAREVKEETGLDVDIGELIGHYCRLPGQYDQPHTSYHMIFHGTVTGGTLQTTEEAIEIGYYDPAPISDWHKDMANATRMAVEWWDAQQTYVGVDACKSGWCLCAIRGDAARIHVHESIDDLYTEWKHAPRIFIDIPIGLASPGITRTCEPMARKMLRGRASTVFPVPARAALNGCNAEEMNARNLEVQNKKLSSQSIGFLPKIREVDEFLERNPGARDQFVEVHPELVFRTLNNGDVVQEKKTTPEGEKAREEILKHYWANAPKLIGEMRLVCTKGKVALDDVIDAMGIAIGMRASRGRFEAIGKPGAVDERGLPMRICIPALSEPES